MGIVLSCPHCPCIVPSDGRRPPSCPECLKAVKRHQWRIVPPSEQRFEPTYNDRHFIMKKYGILAD